MTASIRTATAVKLEAEYSQLKNQQADGNVDKPGQAMNVAAKSSADPHVDTVTLSSKQADIGTPSGLKPSKPVTSAEKTALQSPFSVFA